LTSADRLIDAVDALGEEIVASVGDLIRIPSINPRYPGEDYADLVGEEGRAARFLQHLYARAGADVDLFGLEPGRENCVGVLRGRGGGRSLILNGHVDVVPPGDPSLWRSGDPWSGAVSDDWVWGRGASDMKSGLVAMAFGAIAVRHAGVRLAGDLILQAVVGEEMMEHELGTTACIERGHRADAAVVAEASAPPTPLAVIIETPGAARFIVEVQGRQTHPGLRGSTIWPGGEGSERGVSAIDKAIPIYHAIARLEHEWGLNKRHPLFAPGQFCVFPAVFLGSPRGRLDPFFIPDHAMLDCIVIHHPEDDVSAVRGEVEAVIAAAAATDGWLKQNPPTVTWKHHWPPSRIPRSHPLVDALCGAHRLASGTTAEVRGWTAVHDGSFLAAAGVPTVCYGPGDLGYAHAPDERVSVAEILTSARTYALLIADWCGATRTAPGRPGSGSRARRQSPARPPR
jgi:acetylornithine deacetylase